MSGHKGLDKWFKQDWVDIGSKKKGGGHQKCGRKSAKGSKRKYPKCVPASKAASMTESQKRSAVSRKRSKAQGVGGKPTNVRTFAKRKTMVAGGLVEWLTQKKGQVKNQKAQGGGCTQMKIQRTLYVLRSRLRKTPGRLWRRSKRYLNRLLAKYKSYQLVNSVLR